MGEGGGGGGVGKKMILFSVMKNVGGNLKVFVDGGELTGNINK